MSSHRLLNVAEFESAIGFLKHLNVEELREILKEDSKIEEIVKDLKQLRDMEKEKEILFATNRSLAEYNLSLQPNFEQAKRELLDKTDLCDELFKQLEEKYNILSEKVGRKTLETKLMRLRDSTAELEKASEGLADKFLSGDNDVEEFLDQFTHTRKLMHLEKVMTDKMSEMINQNVPNSYSNLTSNPHSYNNNYSYGS